MELPPSHTVTDLGPFVLGDHTLDLHQQLPLRIVGRCMIEKDDLAISALDLIHQDRLMRVTTGQSVGGVDVDDIKGVLPEEIAQAIQPRAIQVGAAVAIVHQDMLVQELMAVTQDPSS